MDLFDEYVSLVPGRADALNALGVALFNLGRFQEAEQRYREAIDIDPEYANALVNLAALLQASPKAAEPLLRRVLKINPKYPGARAMLGIMLLSSGHEHEAKLAFRKALKVSPKDPIALLGLAQSRAWRVASTMHSHCSSVPWRSARRCRLPGRR